MLHVSCCTFVLLLSKKPNVLNFSTRHSRAGNGYDKYMGAWNFGLQENLHAHKIPPFRWGCFGFFGREGWKCQFLFVGAGIR